MIAIITGSSSGIGITVVKKPIKKGFCIAVLNLKDLPEAFKEQPLSYYISAI
jgi:NAD(P)-dependent dehydrogenase (short-subunit alcohol dehydrogenase family)